MRLALVHVRVCVVVHALVHTLESLVHTLISLVHTHISLVHTLISLALACKYVIYK